MDLNPTYTASYIEYARSSVLLGKRKEGLQKLTMAIGVVQRREDRERLQRERENLAEIFYTNETFQQYQNGLNYMKLERVGSAVEALEKALKTEPDNVLVLAAYARALQAEERQKEAQDTLEKAFALNDGDKGVRLDLAEMLIGKKPERTLLLLKPMGAEASAEERIALLHARGLSALSRNREAVEYLRERAERQQSWLYAQLWLGKLYSLEQNGNWNARKHLMTFLKRTDGLVQEKLEDIPPEMRQLRLARSEAEALLLRVNKALE
jgi:tetratricopeptide (TPR) repeat protein